MSIKLTTGDRIAETSSKGNQEKWREKGRWYKLDLFGYEGLAETVISTLLRQTNVETLGFRYVSYRMERLEVHRRVRNGCSSPDFLQPDESILTLADLFRKGVGPDWQAAVARQPNLAGKVRWMVEQTIRLTGSVIVTTPQDVALADARKGINMFRNDKIDVPILGLIENMAWFTPAELPENRYYIFGRDGGKRLAEEAHIPFLGQIPIVQSIREGGDEGVPAALHDDRLTAQAFAEVARKLAAACGD